jgi:hypothetical protein
MTSTPDRILNRAPVRTTSPTSFPDDQLYMLKLTLELQVEALLLALGSSAVAARGGRHDPGAGGHGAPDASFVAPAAAAPAADLPWQKWLAEDLELAGALTRDCVADGVPLPSSMGLAGSGGPGGVVESLAARYSAMAAVVGEMLDRTDVRAHASAVARLVETRARCEERLDALIGESPESAAERFFTPAEPGHYLG